MKMVLPSIFPSKTDENPR